jgi:hypothetical protein
MTMSELLLKIYQQVIENEDEAVDAGRRIDEWINHLTEPYQDQLKADETEKLKELMYSTAIKSEQEGFQLGVIILVKLMTELLSDL